MTHSNQANPERNGQITALAVVGLISCFATLAAVGVAAPPAPPKPRVEGKRVGSVVAEVRTVATTAEGLPSNDVFAVVALGNGEVFAGTSQGLARYDGHKWTANSSITGPVKLLAPVGGGVYAAASDHVSLIHGESTQNVAPLPKSIKSVEDLKSLAGSQNASEQHVLLGTRLGLFELAKSEFVPAESLQALLGSDKEIRQVAIAADGRVAVAASGGLFLRQKTGAWERLNPVDGPQSWWPRDVRGVAFDSAARLWFASPAGVGRLSENKWSLYTGLEGLPYNDFTTIAAGPGDSVWFGTNKGAIRFDGSVWNYRQGRRWVPDDQVRAISVNAQGDAWFATVSGLGRIERRATTLAEKAAHFETMIDKYHRRTPYGYIEGVSLTHPGDLSEFKQHDSDNDGLWTGMYGAGECFAYGATHDPLAKKRAQAAFEALRFLSQVTQGGTHPAPKGFPARSILPTSGPNPNRNDTPRRLGRQRERDPRWKTISPRWPISADGKWYWKCDTSSDELDGHYFLYSCYYDLVAETEAEREPVRQVVADITDHLLQHDYTLVDHDGKPTRWAQFGPSALNDPLWTEERGLNSLSILSYLAVAEHITGQQRFHDAFVHLVKDQSYLSNLASPKIQFGPPTGNQSDDEMAFMCYFTLLKYSTDPDVRRVVNASLRRYWSTEEPEHSPLFNYIFAASYEGSGRLEPAAPSSCLTASLDFLKRYPLDRIQWSFANSHRLDVVRLPRFTGRAYEFPRGETRTRTVLPIDERFINHWNYDPWTIDGRGAGRALADGASYLLPYYLGRYYGFIIETTSPPNGTSPKLSRK